MLEVPMRPVSSHRMPSGRLEASNHDSRIQGGLRNMASYDLRRKGAHIGATHPKVANGRHSSVTRIVAFWMALKFRY